MKNLEDNDIGVLKSIEMLDIILMGYFSKAYTSSDAESIGKLIAAAARLNSILNIRTHFMIINPFDLKPISYNLAIYLIFDRFRKLVYIGSSLDVKNRLSGHDKLIKSDSYIIVIPMDHLQIYSNYKKSLKLIEKGLICLLQPERNKLDYILGRDRR